MRFISLHCRPLSVAVVLVMGMAVVCSVTAQEMRSESARAANDGQMASARAQVQDRSLSDAVRRVQRETGGRILGAERVPYDGRDINRVKFMDDRGRVRYMDDPSPSRGNPRGPRQAELPPRDANP